MYQTFRQLAVVLFSGETFGSYRTSQNLRDRKNSRIAVRIEGQKFSRIKFRDGGSHIES